jgi:ethanolamine ammonia-lyase small subunit
MTDSTLSLWDSLRKLTAARIALKRSGASLATQPLLEFQLAHARARDAVHEALDAERLCGDLQPLGLPVVSIASQAKDRPQFLMRPDLGRRLSSDAEADLAKHKGVYDVVFVIADGLSARAAQKHAGLLLARLIPALKKDGWRVAPLIVLRHGRVGAGDAVAAALGATCAVILLGERPGLSAPDSLGAYLTWQPTAESTEADRNCISNIRPEGIGYADAARKILHLLRAMKTRGLSGIALKDDSDRLQLAGETTTTPTPPRRSG